MNTVHIINVNAPAKVYMYIFNNFIQTHALLHRFLIFKILSLLTLNRFAHSRVWKQEIYSAGGRIIFSGVYKSECSQFRGRGKRDICPP